jgi:hypothetical protein
MTTSPLLIKNNKEKMFERKYIVKNYAAKGGAAISEIELIRFFSTISLLKLANVNTVYGAFFQLLYKLEIVK